MTRSSAERLLRIDLFTSIRALVLLLALPLALAGCSPGHTATPSDARLVPEYDEAACRIPKARGELAARANASHDDVAVSPYFGKKYDRSDLEAVLRASAVSTGQYVSQLLEGRLYRIQHQLTPGTKVCPAFVELALANHELEEYWQKNSSRIQVPGAMLAGLYFEACYSGETCDEKVLTRPTILIDEARDRWTLVHEMMHHNFNRERKRSPSYVGERTLVAQARFSRDTIVSNLNDYRSTHQKQSLAQLSDQVSWLAQVFFKEILIRGSYEEIAVEGTLMEEFLLGNLQYVAPESARNALWYMDTSLDSGLDLYNLPLTESTEDADANGFRMSLNELEEFVRNEGIVNRWPELIAKVDADRAAIHALHDTARAKINDQGERFEQMHPEQAPRAHHFDLSTAAGMSGVSDTDAKDAAEREAFVGHLEGSAGMRMFRAFRR